MRERRDKASYHAMTGGGHTYKELKVLMQWFTGTMATLHNLCKWKLATSPVCPLCDAAADDTQGHAIGSCKQNEGQRMARHHRAGRLLLKAIARGTRGACIMSADLGSKESCQEDGVRHYPTLASVISNLLSERERRALSRDSVPDIVMRTIEGNTETIHLVELKYTRDNAPEDAAEAAAHQHEALALAIQRSETTPRHTKRKVEMHKIILGMGGSIYTELEGTLHKLGVERTAAANLMRALNTHAVRSLKEIWTTRQRMLKTTAAHRLPKRGVG